MSDLPASVLVACIVAAAILPAGAGAFHAIGDADCLVSQDDAGAGGDTGADAATAVTLPEGGSWGCLSMLDAGDAYRFTIAAGQVAVVSFWAWPDVVLAFELRACDSPDVLDDAYGHAGTVAWGTDAALDVCLFVSSWTDLSSAAPGTRYQLYLEGQRPLCDPSGDGWSGHDADWSSPVAIGEGTTFACLDWFDHADVFVYEARAGVPVTVGLEVYGPPECADIAYGVSAPGQDRYADACADPVTVTPTADGPVHVFVYHWDVGARYLVHLGTGALPDLAIASVSEERGPIQTDVATAPNVVNEQRVIVVDVANEGDVAAAPFWVHVRVSPASCPPLLGDQSCTGFSTTTAWYETVSSSIPPRGSIALRFPWDTTSSKGDQLIVVELYASELDRRVSNNQVLHRTFVVVGGLGGIA